MYQIQFLKRVVVIAALFSGGGCGQTKAVAEHSDNPPATSLSKAGSRASPKASAADGPLDVSLKSHTARPAGEIEGSAQVFLTEKKIKELRERIRNDDPKLRAYVSALRQSAEISVGRVAAIPVIFPSEKDLETIRTGAIAPECGDPAKLVNPAREFTIFSGLAETTTGANVPPTFRKSDAKRVFTLALAYRLIGNSSTDEHGYGAEAVKILKKWMRHPDANFKRVDPNLAYFPDCVTANTGRPSTDTKLNKGIAIAPVAVMFASAFDLLKNTPQLVTSDDPDSDFVTAREWFKNIVLEIEDSRAAWVGNYGRTGKTRVAEGYIEKSPGDSNVGTNHMAWHNAAIYILSTQFSGALTSRKGILGLDGVVRDGASFTKFMPTAIFGDRESANLTDVLAWGRKGEITDRYRGTRSAAIASLSPSYYSLLYPMHNLKAMLLLAEAAKNFDNAPLLEYSDPSTGKTLKWAVEFYGRFLADYSPNENMRRTPEAHHDFVYDPWAYACIRLGDAEKTKAAQRLRPGLAYDVNLLGNQRCLSKEAKDNETQVKSDYWIALWPAYAAFGGADASGALRNVFNAAYSTEKIAGVLDVLKSLDTAGLTPIHPIMYQ